MKELNLILRFFLELALLFSLGYWGSHVAPGILARFGMGLGIPFVVAVIWGMFLSPKASIKLSAPWRLAIEVTLFGFAVAALFNLDFTILPIIFGMVFILNRYLLNRWKET